MFTYIILGILDIEQVWDELFIEESLIGNSQYQKLAIANIYRPP